VGFEETFRSVGLTLARCISFISHAYIFGLVPILWLVLRPSFASVPADAWGGSRTRIASRLEGLTQSALTATAVATLIALVLQFALVSEGQGGEITSEPVLSVLETRFGQVYLLRFPLLVGLVVLLAGRVREWSLSDDEARSPSRAWWLGWLGLSAALLATSTFSGHATVATPAGLAVVNDITHLVCGAVWFSGIVVLAVVLPDAWRGRRPAERVQLLAPVVVRFSKVAMVAIAVVGATGVVNSFLHVQYLRDLWETSYGRAISAKTLVYLAILAVGGINHFFVRERLESALKEGRGDRAQTLFRKTIAIELVMALGVMGLSAFLAGESRTKVIVQPVESDGLQADR
jgi:putative copper export protein